MNIIYEPKGPALEYAPLAVNLYRGCSHGCRYCYAPSCLRMSRDQFAQVSVRSRILESLSKDARTMAGDTRPILLSFTSDPYQEAERTQRVTRDAIHILADNQLQIRLLTKNPAMALELDRDLLLKANVEFGTTMLFVDDKKRAEWEPHAPSIESRMTAMKAAHGLGLRTWVSVEPVIDTKEALRLIETANPFVDLWKVGRWNHDEGAQAIKWPRFAREALELLNSLRADYYIKAGLWQAAEPSVRALFAREVRHEHASVQQ